VTDSEIGKRDRRGDWRPFKRLKPPPLMVWPPQPVGFLKWLFGYPGYLWPWSVLYLVVAVLTWTYLTPALTTMQGFAFGWVGLILARNLAMTLAVYGVWHLRLYYRKSQGTDFKYNSRWPSSDNAIFLFRSQTLENMFWTLVSGVPVWTAFEVVTLWAMANGLIPMLDIQAHPILASLFFVFILVYREVHFYLIHRLIHWPPLYRSVHSLHHKNVNPGPWSGLSMHPVEHALYFSGVLLHWVVASHPIHVIFHLQHLAFAPAKGHSGFERMVIKGDFALQTNDYFHNLHHKYFECNYGGDGTVPLDKWFGTFHDGSEEADETMKKRYFERQKKAAAKV
jgi:sterol desaturase/sphingolipid hydroxylase (fatty acid hydroxylase superfamily)